MLTVGDFKELGLMFVNFDKGTGYNVREAQYFNTSTIWDNYTPTSFAWRETKGVRPKFKGRIEFNADGSQWRPTLDQTPHEVDARVIGEILHTVFTQEMADTQYELELHKANSELLATLTDFMVKNNIGNVGESCIDVAIRELSAYHGVDTRTPKQKAIEEMPVSQDLESLFWEYDDKASNGGCSRMAFKNAVIKAIRQNQSELYDTGYRKPNTNLDSK